MEDFIEHEAHASAPLLTREEIAKALSSGHLLIRDQIRDIYMEGKEVRVNSKLGSGGTKEVFDVSCEGVSYALGICGRQDSPETILEKWKVVLKEPADTAFLRNKGFFVNQFCEIQTIKLKGIDFPAILFKRYQDHPFSIYDSKNITGNDNPLITETYPQDDEGMLKILGPVLGEIQRLILEGIRLSRDNFNLCLSEANLHLYLNDLGNMRVYKFDPEEVIKYLDSYVDWTWVALIHCVSESAYNQNSYLKSINSSSGSLKKKMKAQISMGLG